MAVISMLGKHDLKGPAVDRLRNVPDANHAHAAEEEIALANFQKMASSFFETQNRFMTELRQRSDD